MADNDDKHDVIGHGLAWLLLIAVIWTFWNTSDEVAAQFFLIILLVVMKILWPKRRTVA